MIKITKRTKKGTYTNRLRQHNTHFVAVYKRRQDLDTSLRYLSGTSFFHCYSINIGEYFELQKQEARKNSFLKHT